MTAPRTKSNSAARQPHQQDVESCPDNSKEKKKTTTTTKQAEKDLDSGYAWLILAVMFLVGSSTGGTNRVYGLIYAKQVAVGYYDHAQASWPIATASTVENLAGLLTPALAQFLSWRQIELLATALFVLANFGAYFSDSLALDILCLGLVQGLALSINTVLGLVINNDYFRRYRTTAYGISLSGSTFGILYLGPIVSWRLSQGDGTEFRSAYLAIGCVLALNALLVIFIRPRCEKSNPPKNEAASGGGSSWPLERQLERKESVASIALMCKQKRQSDLQRNRRQSTRRRSTCKAQADFVARGELKKSASSALISSDGRLILSAASLCKKERLHKLSLFSAPATDLAAAKAHQQCETTTHRNCYHANMMITALALRGNESTRDDSSSSSRRSHKLSTTTTTTTSAASHRSSLESWADPLVEQFEARADGARDEVINQAAKGNISSHFSGGQQESEQPLSLELVWALLKSPYLHCVWIMLALYYLIARIFIIILVDLAKDNGLSSAESSSLLNYWSVGELVGRLALCSFVDLQWLSARVCILLTCVALAGPIGLMALLPASFYLYATCSALVAALISLEYVLINVLMIEYLGQSRVTSCYSLGSFISSLALLGRPALIGLFRDRLGSYNGLLCLLSGLSLAFGLLFGLLEPVLVRYWPKRQARLTNP